MFNKERRDKGFKSVLSSVLITILGVQKGLTLHMYDSTDL